MPETPARKSSASSFGLGLLGAVLGGLAGHFLFLWIVTQGFYAVALPGLLVGLGGGWLGRQRSWLLAGLCGLLGLAAGIISEWRAFPFIADPSLGYFLTHLPDLKMITLIMILLGGAGGFYFAIRVGRPAR